MPEPDEGGTCKDDPELPFCKACPDHEACSQGWPKSVVMQVDKSN